MRPSLNQSSSQALWADCLFPFFFMIFQIPICVFFEAFIVFRTTDWLQYEKEETRERAVVAWRAPACLEKSELMQETKKIGAHAAKSGKSEFKEKTGKERRKKREGDLNVAAWLYVHKPATCHLHPRHKPVQWH